MELILTFILRILIKRNGLKHECIFNKVDADKDSIEGMVDMVIIVVVRLMYSRKQKYT